MPFRVRAIVSYCLLVVVCCLMSGAATQALAAEPIDLAKVTPDADLAAQMEVRRDETQDDLTPREALAARNWQRGEKTEGLLAEPREHSTIWLRGTVTNASAEPIKRWLQLSPWRLEQVDTWLMAPDTGRVLARAKTGLNVPVDERTVQSSRALVPVTLAAGETRQLLLRVTSYSRPFLTLKSWEPVAFTNAQATRYQYHTIALASLLTLLVVLLLQWDYRYALVGAWMLATFVLEAEKEGYISFVLLSGLADYALTLRVSGWLLGSALFLTISVYLLGLGRHRLWRWLPPVALGTAAVVSALSLVWDGDDIRNLGIVLDASFLAAWLCLMPAALRQRHAWQWAFVLLMLMWWLIAVFFLLGYAFNFYYTAALAPARVVMEIVVSLGLLGAYAGQKRSHERHQARQLRQWEQTQRAQLEHQVATRTCELEQAVAEADRANAAKTDFLARITHDLRSPLTSIMGYNQLLAAEGGRTGEISRTVHASAEHMLNLVNRLIDYARGTGEGEVRMDDVYLTAFLEGIGREARMTAQKNGNAFRLVMSPDLPGVVRSDDTYLRQMLLNLLDNAARHTERGTIELSVSCRPGTGQKGVILVFSVSDDGCGIPREQQSRLWEPFNQLSNRHGALGLGLSIVKQLAHQLGAELMLDSEPGRGTRIGFEMPVSPGYEENAGAAVTRTPHHVLPHLDAAGLEAWVVEDASAIGDFLRTELDGLGFVTRLFASAEAFIDAADTASAPPDLVLTDHHLPGASGDTVLATSRHQWPEVPVVLLSATQKTQRSVDPQSGHDYTARLTKPVHLARLRRVIASACRCELSVPPPTLLQTTTQPVAPEAAVAELDTEEQQRLAHRAIARKEDFSFQAK